MRLIASVTSATAAEMVTIGRSALSSGADLVELRLDSLAASQLEALWPLAPSLGPGRWMATLRSREEGGACAWDNARRRETLTQAAAAGAAFLDLELRDLESTDWDSSPAGRAGRICSHHCLAGIPSDPEGILRRLGAGRSGRPGAAKLAWTCQDASENLAALDLMRSEPDGRIVVAMGECGLMSRVLARKCAAFGTFCAASTDSVTAPGQASLARMIHEFGWPRHDRSTEVFAVLGSPIAHSLSPALFNHLFAASGGNAVYLPIRVDSEADLQQLLAGVCRRDWLHVQGFSVTVPHKRAVLGCAAGRVEPLAQRIGAANTLVVARGALHAYNTDYAGAMAAIQAALPDVFSPRGGRSLRVAVLGAGGVARAVVAGLASAGADVTVYNRTASRAHELARDFDCQVGDWADRQRHGAELLVNCTSLGMSPNMAETPMPAEGLREGLVVFDTIYNPRETRLLKLARGVGCRVIDGVAMFVHQAAAQYQLWTGESADLSAMHRFLSDRLS